MLAGKITEHNFEEVVLLGVPRGGIIVAEPIAEQLNKRLDVLVSRKIGHPANPQVAIGAVMADSSAVLDEKMIKLGGISQEYIQQRIVAEYEELKRRLLAYTGTQAPPSVLGKQR